MVFRIGLLCLVGGAVVATEGMLLRRLVATRPGETDSGEVARAPAREQDIERWLQSTLRAMAKEQLEPQVVAAAHVHQLIAGLDIEADSRTFQDLFETEDWWSAYRTRFPLNALVTRTGALAVLGARAGDVAKAPLVDEARRLGIASGVTRGNGLPFLASAAKVTWNKHAEMSAVVVLGTPLDAKVIDRVAATLSPGSALGVSDGHTLLFFSARPETSPAARAALLASVGRESVRSRWVDDQRVVQALALAPALWLLAYLPVARVSRARGSWPVVLGGSTVFLLGLILLGYAAWAGGTSRRQENVVIAGDASGPPNGRRRALDLPLVGGDPSGRSRGEHPQ